MKRPRNLAHPLALHITEAQKQLKVSKPVGNSKQAIAKHKANKCVQSGTFVHDPKRWREYKKKLAQLDPNFEVLKDPKMCSV